MVSASVLLFGDPTTYGFYVPLPRNPHLASYVGRLRCTADGYAYSHASAAHGDGPSSNGYVDSHSNATGDKHAHADRYTLSNA